MIVLISKLAANSHFVHQTTEHIFASSFCHVSTARAPLPPRLLVLFSEGEKKEVALMTPRSKSNWRVLCCREDSLFRVALFLFFALLFFFHKSIHCYFPISFSIVPDNCICNVPRSKLSFSPYTRLLACHRLYLKPRHLLSRERSGCFFSMRLLATGQPPIGTGLRLHGSAIGKGCFFVCLYFFFCSFLRRSTSKTRLRNHPKTRSI